MKTVEIKLSEKEFKHLESAIKSQLENWKFPINTALRYKELLKDPNISKSDAKVYKDFIKIVIEKDKCFISAVEKIKNNLVAKNRELKARVNTLEIENELLKDKRLDELIKSLDKQNHYEEQAEKIKKLEIKNQQLREVIKELGNGKTHK